jgi:hypothetical protein
MHTVGIVLIVIGIFYAYMIILRPPWVLNNIKVRTMIKMMGLKGFWIFFVCWATLILGLGILFVNIY